jgi:hypothetical protein
MLHPAGIRYLIRILPAAVLALAACEGTTDPMLLPPTILELNMDASGGPIFRTLRVRLDRAAAVEVAYWAEAAEPLQVVAPAALDHAIFLPRLRAGTSYDFQLRSVDEDGRPGDPLNGHFSTGALPAALAELRFTASGAPTSPLVLLVVSGEPGTFSGYVVTDASGNIVWYLATEGAGGITRRANGNFAFVSGSGLVEASPTGQTVAEMPTDPVGRRFHHDVIAGPGNTLLAIATDTQTVGGTRITGEAIWEWQPETGESHKRWSAFDFLDPVDDRGPRFSEANWMHANSLWLGPRGNVLLSSNFLNQIISISADFSALEWRLGGPNATIRVPDEERFSGQHTAAELENGHVLLFDNRQEQGVYSRAVEFALEDGKARRVWEWRPERENFAFAVSSARRRPGGSTLVTFGMSTGLLGSTGPIEVYEVSHAGEVLWHLEVQGTRLVYRAEPMSDIDGEIPISSRAAMTPGGSVSEPPSMASLLRAKPAGRAGGQRGAADTRGW